jgi:N utilization substance protein A
MVSFDYVPDDGGIESQIRSAFAPLEVREVLLCVMLKRAYVLLGQSQSSLARSLAPRAERQCSWEVSVLTEDDLAGLIDTAVAKFAALEGTDAEMAQRLVGQGYVSYRDLSSMTKHQFAEMCEIVEHHAAYVLHEATRRADSEDTARRTRPADTACPPSVASMRRTPSDSLPAAGVSQ